MSIAYNPEEMPYDEYTEVTLTITDATSVSPYGKASYAFKAGIPAPWESLGMGTYVEDCVSALFGVENVAYAVEVQENMENRGIYRLVNPYGKAYPYNEEGDYDASQNYYMEINAQDPEGVYITRFNTGMDWGYGECIVWSMANYYMVRQGLSLEDVKAEGLCGTLSEGLITFPKESLLFGMMDYQDGGLYPANGNGKFTVALPGTVIADYSVSVAYEGLFTAVDKSISAVASVVLGTDVEVVKVAMIAGTDAETLLNGIVDGSIEAVSLEADGEVKLPLPEDAVSGRYTIMAVSYADGEAQEYATSSFRYEVPSSETWTEIGTGTYTYVKFFEGDDAGLSLWKSDQTPNRYKISHWGNDVDFTFSYNPETGEVLVDEQEIGYVHPDYGMVNVVDYVTYTGSTSATSYYEDGTFYFALVYFVSDGVFGYGYETFTLDAENATQNTRALAGSIKQLKANIGWPSKLLQNSCPAWY